MFRLVASLCLVIAALALPVRANADLDDRNFVGSFLGNDAEAGAFFGVEVHSDKPTSSAESFLEKTLSKQSSLGLIWGLRQSSAPAEQSTFGTDNLSIVYNYVFLTLGHHELAVAASPFVELSAGDTFALRSRVFVFGDRSRLLIPVCASGATAEGPLSSESASAKERGVTQEPRPASSG